MPKVTFESANAEPVTLDASEGDSLMETAKAANIDGIDADCGGSMVCGTCHVYVADEWIERLAPPSEMEQEILECVPVPNPKARLSCQIIISPNLDGLTVRLPDTQR